MAYTYLLVIGLIVAFIDAFGIGANDNANNFANAIASGVVTPAQAVLISAVFEFLGSILVGNNVAEAIRGRIISTNLFRSNPYSLQLAMVCALIGSSTWLMLATRYAVPVSTTHSIIGGVLGVGVAAFGPPAINWEYGGGRGFAGIVASWFISIAVSGVMAATAYLIMKYTVLRYKNSFQRGLVFAPIMFGLTYGIMSLALVWKGTPKLKLDNIPNNQVVAIVVGVWASSMVLTYLWVCIPMYRYHWLGQDLKWIDYILGPVAPQRPVRSGFDVAHIAPLTGKGLFNSELDPAFSSAEAEIAEHNTLAAKIEAGEKVALDDIATKKTTVAHMEEGTPEEPRAPGAKDSPKASSVAPYDGKASATAEDPEITAMKAKLAKYEAAENTPRRAWFKKWKEDYAAASIAGKAYLLARFVIMFGIDGREIRNYRTGDVSHLKFAPKWSSKTEDMFISLNVITSCIQSFAHGSNDVANAIGPLSTIYFIWANGRIPGNSSPVEIWQLAYGGAAICLGLALYGYNLMRVLGNNLTYQSPSRGFCMDLGSAITILIASKEGFPISTTQCITGATVGVGLANGEWRAVNWKLFAKIFASWVITLPAAGTLAGLIYAFTAYSPTQPHSPASV